MAKKDGVARGRTRFNLRGKDLHEVGRDGKTALAGAAEQGRQEVVRYLEQAGAMH
jgi:hypothetical protein